ncbi:SH3 domain-containing protein [Hymenobacter guriensis]|uniref:SH3 domain-containing protein n=1 Tax=Hymenobacter guriensis TaxID=2793065 RepID=UPI0018CB6C87|nr:SH3 domain-containing protein [Hymenobacter guriensis]
MRQTSIRQLVRMAYIQEQLGHYPAALYYLAVAQRRWPTAATWNKMTELAQANRLEGYASSWQSSIRLSLERYYMPLLEVLLTVAVAVGTVLLARLLKRRPVETGWWVAFGVYVALLAGFVNVFQPEQTGLVCRAQAVIMSGPGAGASWLTVAAAGDRLVVQGRQDIWYKVLWHGQTAYIRQGNLLLVE